MLRYLALLCGVLPAALGCGYEDPLHPAVGDDAVDEMARLVNDHRALVGCAPLSWDDELARVASAHSRDMVERGYVDHTTPDGLTFVDRLSAVGVAYSLAAENIAVGSSDASAVVELWLRSTGHRANIEQCRFDRHGAGMVDGHWTHLFIEAR